MDNLIAEKSLIEEKNNQLNDLKERKNKLESEINSIKVSLDSKKSKIDELKSFDFNTEKEKIEKEFANKKFESENKIPEIEDESENNIFNDVQYRFSELNDMVQDTDVKSQSMKFSNKSSIQVLLCVILIGLLVFMNCNKDPTIHWGIIASIIVASILFVFVTLK